jgi:hypothetical protein
MDNNVAVIVAENDMQRKNVGTHILAVFVILQIMIITSGWIYVLE